MFRLIKRLDFPLLIAVGLLFFISIFMIFSASVYRLESHQEGLLSALKHMFSFTIGSLVFLGFLSFNYRLLRNYWWVLYGLSLALLLFVLFFGHSSQGAQRWINLGFFVFQPSELAKLVIIIAISGLLSKNKEINTLRNLFPLLALVGVPFLLVASQPDLGTALVFIFILLTMLILANVTNKLLFMFFSPLLSLIIFYSFPQWHRLIWFVYLIGVFAYLASRKTSLFDTFICLFLNIVIVFIAPLFWGFLHPYQQERLLVFISKDIDPYAQGVRYHIDKSIVAVGSGGLLGHGFLKGPLAHLQYIPVQNSDFIFSVIGEELGFWGSSIILFLLGTIVFRAIRIAQIAEDNFGSLLASGIGGYFLFQIFINMGMTMGIMPVVGIPLPFLSFGGSALVTNLAAVGLLQNIACRRGKLLF